MYFGNETREWILLEKLIDVSDNELTIFITKTRSGNPSTEDNKILASDNKGLFKVLEKSVAIFPDYEQLYRIHFSDYVMYQSRNESYAHNENSEIAIGHGLIIFEKSKLLEYIGEFICIELAMAHNETKLRHYGVYTLNNVIDIITFHEPVIERVKST